MSRLSNKSMLTNKYNRKVVTREQKPTCCNTTDNKLVGLDDLKKVYTYHKPSKYNHLSYHDEYKHDRRCRRYGSMYLEFDNDTVQWNTTEQQQYTTLVNVACKVVYGMYNNVTCKLVADQLNKYNMIVDYHIIRERVKDFKTRYNITHNKVKNNPNHYGYDSEDVRPNHWSTREHWEKLMRICDL